MVEVELGLSWLWGGWVVRNSLSRGKFERVALEKWSIGTSTCSLTAIHRFGRSKVLDKRVIRCSYLRTVTSGERVDLVYHTRLPDLLVALKRMHYYL